MTRAIALILSCLAGAAWAAPVHAETIRVAGTGGAADCCCPADGVLGWEAAGAAAGLVAGPPPKSGSLFSELLKSLRSALYLK